MDEFEFKKTINNNPILLRHKDLLKSFGDDRIMCVGYDQKYGFYIRECCDEWFSRYITLEECLELSKLFEEIANALLKV